MQLSGPARAYIAAALLATPATAGTDPAPLAAVVPGMEVQAPAAPPVTAFTRADGTEGDLSDYAGQVVVLNFWATWCAPCKAEMPSLQSLQDTVGGDGVAVVTMAFGRHNPAQMAAFFEEAGIDTLPLHLDAAGDLARGVGVTGLPTTVILDEEGRVIARMTGEADWAAPGIVAALRALR